MASWNKEIEIKLPLCNETAVIGRLQSIGDLVSRDVYQMDIYFIPPHRNFLNERYPYEWLRLRKTNKDSVITYKHFYPEGVEKTDYCDEFESIVGSFESVRKILESLNFKEVAVVEKKRSTWRYERVEISIDTVTDLGSYIELECTEDFRDPKEAKIHLYSVLNMLGASVWEEDLRGYPFRILEKNGYIFSSNE